MLERTHIPEAPWWVVEAVDKKRARLNCIAHLLTRSLTRKSRKAACPRGSTTPSTTAGPPRKRCTCRDHYATLVAEAAK